MGEPYTFLIEPANVTTGSGIIKESINRKFRGLAQLELYVFSLRRVFRVLINYLPELSVVP